MQRVVAARFAAVCRTAPRDAMPVGVSRTIVSNQKVLQSPVETTALICG
jgi:hypothetical protein